MKTTATPIARRVVSFALALLFVATSPSAFALTETMNGVDWPYSVSSGGATLGGGSSSTPAIPKATSAAVEIPSELGGVPVTSIANYAFSGCSNAKTLKYGKAAKLAKCKFKAPKGRKFAGWATSKANAKAGKVKYRNGAAIKGLVASGKTVKLYAVWKKK